MKWETKLRLGSKRWMLPPIVLAVAVVVAIAANRKGPQQSSGSEEARPLRVIRVPVVDLIPRAIAYGTAKPAQVWQAVSEVRGRVVEVHPSLKSGSMVRQGDILLNIDPSEYDLAISQFEADVSQIHAQLEELTTGEVNDQASLEIEQASLTLAQRELARVQSLVKQNAVSKSEVDKQDRNMLAQRQNVLRLENSLRLVPQRRKSLVAALAVKNAGLAQAQLDRGKTVIRAPFDCRLGEVAIGSGQFLAAGQVLFEAHGTEATEMEVQIPADQLRNLIRPELQSMASVTMDAETVQKIFDFQVTVRFRSGDFSAEWEGRVTRLREQFDPRTRTIGLVLVVDKPYEKAIPGKRPPLVQGMFCEAELCGSPRRQRIVIPRNAVHEGHVYVVGEDSRLYRREVEIEFAQSGFVCLQSGLQGGEMLIVSDPSPAIEGMLVEAELDESVSLRLVAEATGEGRLR